MHNSMIHFYKSTLFLVAVWDYIVSAQNQNI